MNTGISVLIGQFWRKTGRLRPIWRRFMIFSMQCQSLGVARPHTNFEFGSFNDTYSNDLTSDDEVE
jgi:hypothetical protein